MKVGWGANYFSTASLARGLYHAADIEADVAFVGLGGLPSGAWADALNACYERGVVVVAAAGNSLNTHPMGQMVSGGDGEDLAPVAADMAGGVVCGAVVANLLRNPSFEMDVLPGDYSARNIGNPPSTISDP